MAGANIERELVQQAIKACSDMISEVERTKQDMAQKYKSLGANWSDAKYQQLGDIVGECSRAMNKMAQDLRGCQDGLRKLDRSIGDYEEVSFSGSDHASFSGVGVVSGVNQIIQQSLSSSPRKLIQTQYGFESTTINGTSYDIYNKPFTTANSLIRVQGHNSYNMRGVCGICQSANLLRLAGVTNASEDLLIQTAMNSSPSVRRDLDINNSDPDERGGTTSYGRQEILEQHGLDTYILPVNSDRTYTVNEIAQAVSTGHGVIVSVDVARLWRNGQSGGHAISILSVSRDGSMFVYSDTGAGSVGTISAGDLADALTGRPANITSYIIR